MRDDEIIARRVQFANIGRNYERLAALDDARTPLYTVPESGPPKLEYRGLPLDEIEDLLPRSSAYRQAARIHFPSPAAFKGGETAILRREANSVHCRPREVLTYDLFRYIYR